MMIYNPAMSVQKGIKNPFYLFSALSLSLLSFASAQAADFSKAKHTYVPASQIDRRVDFSSMRESISVPTRKTATVTKNVKLSSPHPTPKNVHSSASKISNNHLAKMKQTAKVLQKSGRLDEAQRTLTAITQISPNDKEAAKSLAEVSTLRAKHFMAANDFPNALSATRQALAANPANPEAHRMLSQLYEKAGANPANVQARLQTAETLYKQGQYKEAEVEYQASLAVQPTAEAHIGLGKIAEKFNGPLAARQHYEQALTVDPSSASAHREIGLWHHNAGDLVTANSALSNALILNQQDPEASKGLVKLWQNQVAKAPNANSHMGLARAYQLSGDLQSAQAEYRQVVQLEPNHPYLPAARKSFKNALSKQEADKYIQSAHALESQGQLQDAFYRANTAVSLHPTNINNRLYQGELLEKLGQPGQARQVYAAILKEDPTNAAASGRMQALPEAALIGTSQPAGFPGTKFGNILPSNTADAATTIAANAYPAGIPVDQVGSLSNFMGSVRNQMLANKNQWQQTEDAAHQAIRNIGMPQAQTTGLAQSLQSPTSVPDDYISRILASPVGSPLPGQVANNAGAPVPAFTGAPVPTFTGAPVPVFTSAPVPSIAGSPVPVFTGAPVPSLLTAPSTAGLSGPIAAALSSPLTSALGTSPALGASSSIGAPVPAPISTLSAAAPKVAPFAASPLATIASPAVINSLVASAAPTSQKISGAIQAAGMLSQTTAALPEPKLLPQITNLAPAVAPSFTPVGGNYQAFPAPPLIGTKSFVAPGPVTDLALLRPALPSGSSFQISPSALRFELAKITPTGSNVQLAVVLKNDSDKEINLPGNLKAVIKYMNKPEAEVQASFAGRSIPPHSSLNGIVIVPFDKADPNADLVLRNLLLQSSDPDLHLITTSAIR